MEPILNSGGVAANWHQSCSAHWRQPLRAIRHLTYKPPQTDSKPRLQEQWRCRAIVQASGSVIAGIMLLPRMRPVRALAAVGLPSDGPPRARGHCQGRSAGVSPVRARREASRPVFRRLGQRDAAPTRSRGRLRHFVNRPVRPPLRRLDSGNQKSRIPAGSKAQRRLPSPLT